MKNTRPYLFITIIIFTLLLVSSNSFSQSRGVPNSELRILQGQFFNLKELRDLTDLVPHGTYQDILQRRLDEDIDRFRNLILLFGDDDSSEGEIISATPGDRVFELIFCPSGSNFCGCDRPVSCRILESWCGLTGGTFGPASPFGGSMCTW